MSLIQIQQIIAIIPIIIAIFTFAMIISVALTCHPGKAIIRTYERVNLQLREQKNGLFDYDKTNRFLKANGAEFHYGNSINPIKYLVFRLCAAAILFIVGIRFHAILSIALTLLGFLTPGILLVYMNQQDNDKMIPEIQTLYNALRVQIKAGVYISDALLECYGCIQKGRLRKALEELSNELFMKSSYEEAIEQFGSKFNNGFIDALCVILKQAHESGQAVSLLNDMSEQIKDMQSALLLKKKEKLNRVVTISMMGVLSAIIAVILYACIMNMYSSVSSL